MIEIYRLFTNKATQDIVNRLNDQRDKILLFRRKVTEKKIDNTGKGCKNESEVNKAFQKLKPLDLLIDTNEI